MAGSSTNLSLIIPVVTDKTIVRDIYNTNWNTIDGRFAATYMAIQAKASVSITGGSITGITDLAVADGGTGKSAWTQYLIPYADTTTSLSQIAIGTNGQVLTSGGAGVAPSFENASGGGASTALDNLASVAINAALLLGTSDAAALGSTSKMWSDLFLASGAVINFNNGDVTLTHSANILTLGGGALALGANNLTMSGSIADTTNRVTKLWADDIESTNDITIGGTALASIYAAIAQNMYIGTTQVAINRGSGALTLAGLTLTTPDIGTPSAGTLTNCSFPTLNQNTTGTAANLSGTPDLPDGTTATTQSAADNSTKLATTAYADTAAAAGGATTALDNLASIAINISLTSDTDITDDLGTGDIRWKDIHAATLNSGLTATDTLKLRGYDVDGTAYVDILTITSANTVTADLNAITTLGGSAILVSGGDAGTPSALVGTNISGTAAGLTAGNASVAALATTLTVTDNESTNESNAILFTANAEQGGGNLAIESDGTLTYNPSTGKITATGFVGALTGQADTVATITTLAPDTATTQATQAGITTCANLTSIGTIATGVWEATDVALAHGGTGVSTGAMVNFTSILNAALYVGRDADNQIKFASDNTIVFRLSGVDGASFISTGEFDMGAHSIGFIQQAFTAVDATTTIDWKLGNKFEFTFDDENQTFTFTAPTNPCNLVLVLIQDVTGSRTAAWPGTVKWADGTAPTLSTAGGSIDIVSFYYDGTSYYGVGNNAFAVP